MHKPAALKALVGRPVGVKGKVGRATGKLVASGGKLVITVDKAEDDEAPLLTLAASDGSAGGKEAA